MNNGWKWVLSVACFCLLFGGLASGQTTPADFNRLCLHNGGDYYIGSLASAPNSGSGKYYPSYTHITSIPDSGSFLTKIRGWSWVGMKGPVANPVFNWTGFLSEVISDDYNYLAVPSSSMSCTFPAPHAWASGTLLTGGGGGMSNPVFTFTFPSSVPVIGGKGCLIPSSSSWTPAANVFALTGGSINLGTVNPFYGYDFAYTYASSHVGIASSSSIYQWIYEDHGSADCHYLIVSGNEMDHAAGYPYSPGDGPGYKGKAQMLIYRPPYQAGSPAQNGGSSQALDMCLLLEDSVLIPANKSIHASLDPGNPFNSLGFDVGTACMTPLVSDGGAYIGFTTENFHGPGQSYAILASAHRPGNEYIGRTSLNGKVYPCGPVDAVTQWFISQWSIWLHTVAYPYPACAYGNYTVGGNSAFIPITAAMGATLYGQEYIFCGYPVNSVHPECTSAFMVCWN